MTEAIAAQAQPTPTEKVEAQPAQVKPEAQPVSQEAAPSSLMDEVSAEEKASQEAADKKLMETKDEDLKTPEEKARKAELVQKQLAADKAAKEAVIPETYVIKPPEGMTLDQGLLDKFTPIFKEAKITQAEAQKLADAFADYQKTVTAQTEKAQAENFTKFVEDLKAETIKTLGANYKQELAFAAKARDRFASPELIDKLNQSGLSNDKDVIALFIRLGKTISEDKLVEGKVAIPVGDKKPETVLYDHPTSQNT